ncbi:MAG TPA: PSD1 and planctomycete cytochrome C domain-containing protein [Gemmataceae bacterium]|nr:PSD1 and planctomycete cytochrome C domain-containing protein [Gemmataceae bacterium]
MKAAVLSISLLAVFGLAAAAPAEPPPQPPAAVNPQAAEFFETRVRPVLAENCFTCHGPKRQQAGLRLDSRAALLKGSDSGPVITAGEPEKSLLIQAVRQEGDIKMPPKGKLPPEAIEALIAWVKMGAPWPENGSAAAQGGPMSVAEARQKHWAFQPVRKPALPPVRNSAWVRTPVDFFILAKLEEKGLNPSPSADRRTLIRRVTFDLIGLPPTPEEVTAFESDTSPNAFARVVDRLLADPRYGERWGRHWLDIARYADTKGYVFQEERRYPFAYTYRDYVIRAFNEDLPYDQFILHQLAADQLFPLTLPSPPGAGGEGRVRGSGDNRPLAAMGFLTVGRRFLNNIHDIIDDRLDVVGRGLLGLTISCARCHDHKFDPIPQRDYYSLYGVFASSVEPRELPLIGEPESSADYLAFEKELKARQQKLADFLQNKHAELLARLRAQVPEYLLAARDAQRLPGEDHYQALAASDLNPALIRRWQGFLTETRKAHHPVLAPWHAFAALPQKDFTSQAAAVAARVAANADPQGPINPLVAQAFAGPPPASLRDVAERYGKLLAGADRLWQEALKAAKEQNAAPPAALPDPDQEALRQLLYGPGTPTNISLEEAQSARLFDRSVRNELTALRRRVEEWVVNSPAAPPRAMVLQDAPMPQTPRVFVRGNPNNPGEAVPRQFLEVLAGPQRQPFRQGSGRLELARAIASRDNPLTARVLVNRVWLHHFGAGLVRTPSDFGLRGEPPTHPELLDYLAWTFMEDGWSIKKLHRLILLSAVYQQASEIADCRLRIADSKTDTSFPRLQSAIHNSSNPQSAICNPQLIDPENRLLWKMNRQRLDFEALRDSLLAVAGRLDARQGGRPVDLTTAPFSTRRTVYGFVERQNLPGLFRTFDFASPDTSSPQRYTTTVPQQALFLMNSPFVIEQARHLVGRPDVAALQQPEARIERLYCLLYGRPPDAEEVALGLRFLESARPLQTEAVKLTAWEQYAQVLLLSNEFVFMD